MKNYTTWACALLACSLVLLLTAGCVLPSTPVPVEEPKMSEKTSPTAPAAMPPAKRVPAVEPLDKGGPAIPLPFESPTEMAVHDLARRLGVDADDIVVMDIKEMDMPAADLGCLGTSEAEAEAKETPGEMVKGQEIVLAVDGREYVYRAHGWRVLPCRPPAEFSDLPLPPRPGQVGAPVEAARQDLSGRLGMSVEDVEVQVVEAVEWSDASLGCPQPGMMYAQVITPGYRILLRAGGKTYEYHSDQKRAILCQPAKPIE